MSDVANILGVAQAVPTTAADEAVLILSGKTAAASAASAAKSKGRKPKGMSRELFSLMGQDGLAPAVQTNKAPVVSGFKTKRVSAFQGKWLWAPFSNSARGYVAHGSCIYHNTSPPLNRILFTTFLFYWQGSS